MNSNVVNDALSQTRLLKDFCSELKFDILGSNSATRITSTSQSVIGIVMTNSKSYFSFKSDVFSGSDHHIIFVRFRC